MSNLRECELCIFNKKYTLGISCAQNVLRLVMTKLEKPHKKKRIKEMSMVAINAFYKIGLCEEATGQKKLAEIAYENANIIGKKYLNHENILSELKDEVSVQNQIHNRKNHQSKDFENFRRKSERKLTQPKIALENVFSPQHSSKTGEKDDQINFFGRYYSNSKLERLSKLLFEKKDPIILNSDNYFYNHISKALSVGEDLQEKAEVVSKKVKDHIDEIVKSKEFLKSRRKFLHYEAFHYSSNEYINKKINLIEQKFENKLKLQEIKLKSKLKSKIYRKLLKSINFQGRFRHKITPEQTLFFTEPVNRRLTIMMTEPLNLEPKKGPVKKKVEDINQEIEDQLELLYKEINGKRSLNISPVLGSIGSSNLSNSALKPKKSIKSLNSPIRKKATLKNFGY